jgi:hypothetical protein
MRKTKLTETIDKITEGFSEELKKELNQRLKKSKLFKKSNKLYPKLKKQNRH